MPTPAFGLHARCEVVYDGRAFSTLEEGDYLVLCKPDGCIAVHGGCFVKPLNYQNPGSDIRIIKSGDEFDDLWMNLFGRQPSMIIKATNKGESLVIAVHEVHRRLSLDGMSTSKISLVRSERDLVTQVTASIGRYFPAVDAVLVDTEVPTPYGLIDIMLVDRAGVRHIAEVKRRVMSVAGCGQLARYATSMSAAGFTVAEYLVAPAISRNAARYALDRGQSFVAATFDDAGD